MCIYNSHSLGGELRVLQTTTTNAIMTQTDIISKKDNPTPMAKVTVSSLAEHELVLVVATYIHT